MNKSLIAVMAGLIVGFVMIMVLESIGHSMFPLPGDINVSEPQTLQQIMKLIPLPALWSVLAAWALASLGGGWLSARLAPGKPTLHALIVGSGLLLAGIANLLMIPHPVWFSSIGILLFLPSAWLGSKLV